MQAGVKLTHTGIVTAREYLRKGYVLLSIHIEDRPAFKPGQFMMLEVSGTYDPLLLRPFSILDSHEGVYRFLVKVTGRGTQLLAGFTPGRRLFLTGPFGNGFPAPVRDGAVVVAGGVGIASVFSYVRMLQKKGVPFELFYGARTQDDLVVLDLLDPYHPVLSTDDGSMGHHGKVTDILRKQRFGKRNIVACGPLPMLAAVRDIALRHQVPCFISLEARMACGFGVCLGCTIFDTNGRTRRVCKDGPVFNAVEVSFEKQAAQSH